MYGRGENKVRYKGAQVEIFGLPLIPLPSLSQTINNEASSGILVPEIRLDRSNGFEIAVPYYLRIAPDRDMTITPHLYTDAAPMIEGEFRSEEHTSELQSLMRISYAVFCLKKKKTK